MAVIRGAVGRRAVLAGVGAAAFAGHARAVDSVDFAFPGGYGQRGFTTAFPQKGRMILQRARPPLLETPLEVFDRGVLTPNDQFYVRWHWAEIPTTINADSFRLQVRGLVNTPLSLSLADLTALPSVELVAVNQCAGNSRGFFAPRVPGAEWGNGAMGNARWTGVRLRDVLDKAGVKEGAVAVRCNGLDQPTSPDGPDFMKSLSVDHARDGEVMIAYAMNGENLPLLNGFPLRLVVPGWFATYWIKMLNDIEVLDKADDNFWMAKAYLIPDTPHGSIAPGQTGVKMVPVSRMAPRSFITNVTGGSRVAAGAPVPLRGIAFGGDTGVKSVEVSTDGGASWQAAELGEDAGKYSFRRWRATFTPARGEVSLLARCTNSDGEAQPLAAGWNPSGYMRNLVETVTVTAG